MNLKACLRKTNSEKVLFFISIFDCRRNIEFGQNFWHYFSPALHVLKSLEKSTTVDNHCGFSVQMSSPLFGENLKFKDEIK